MATNLIGVNVYQINQNNIIPLAFAGNNPVYIPSTGIVVNPVQTSDTNPLPNGVYVYSQIIMPNGALYYTGLTASAVKDLANA
jgi:hypothetical protein